MGRQNLERWGRRQLGEAELRAGLRPPCAELRQEGFLTQQHLLLAPPTVGLLPSRQRAARQGHCGERVLRPRLRQGCG